MGDQVNREKYKAVILTLRNELESSLEREMELKAENERIRRALNAKLSDHINGAPCAAIRWEQEREDLEARLADARKLLSMAVPHVDDADDDALFALINDHFRAATLNREYEHGKGERHD